MTLGFMKQPNYTNTGRYSLTQFVPKVSVVTSYIEGTSFSKTFCSVLSQTFPWFEWIILCNTTMSAEDKEQLFQHAHTESRIRVIETADLSASAAMSLAVKSICTGIIIPLESGDVIDPVFFECLYITLALNPEAICSYTDSIAVAGNGHREYFGAIRKSAIIEAGCSPESGYLSSQNLWLKLMAAEKKVIHVEKPLVVHRQNEKASRAHNKAKAARGKAQVIAFRGKRKSEFKKPEKWEWEYKLPYAEEKIRILMLLPHMERGGADKFNLDVLKNVDRSRFEFGIITTNPDANEWRKQFSEYADDIFELPSFLDMSDWASFIHYYIYSRDVQIVWNLSSYYGYYVMPWLRTEFPQVAMIDCVHAEGKYWRAGGYPRVSAALDGILEKTFVSNEYTRDIMVEFYHKPAEKMQVIHTGIDETELDPDKVDCSGLKKDLGIGEERPVVLFLCRIAPEKRPYLMLEIAKETKKRIPDICFLVVGDGPQLEELKARTKKSDLKNTVYFVGGQKDIKPFYKLSDLFLLCSIKEGLSITTMESMSMHLPVVSADVGSQYELVSENTGRLIKCRQDEAEDFDSRSFPQEEVQDYVNAICELLHDGEILTQLGQNCRNKILDGFTLSCLMDILESSFVALCSGKPDRIKAGNPDIYTEFITLYTEYESSQTELCSMQRRMKNIKDVLTFKKSIIWLIKKFINRKHF